MSTIFDNDILIHHIGTPGLPGDGFTAPEAATLRNDVDTLLSRPIITELDAIPDVDAASPVDGDTLVFDGATQTWRPGAAGGTISQVRQSWGANPTVVDATAIRTLPGLSVIINGPEPTVAYLQPSFGGTGSATNVARSDHSHTTPSMFRPEFGPTGYMSGGSRVLATTNVALANGVAYRVDAALKMQVRGGDPGPCYYTQTVEIDGNARTSPGGTAGKWAVQGVPRDSDWSHSRIITGTGGTIPISASIAYHSGGGIYPDFGEIVITLTPNK